MIPQESLLGERWRAVVGHEGLYLVSDYGRVYSLPKGGRRGRMLNPHSVGECKHQGVKLYRGDGMKGRRAVKVHQLVMAAFVGPIPPGLEILHWDDDPSNNHLANLRYGTRSENMRDLVRNGRHRNASATHCIHGHEFTPRNTLRSRDGRRACRACNYRRRDEYRLKLKTPTREAV